MEPLDLDPLDLEPLDPRTALPDDLDRATLVGRVRDPATGGPVVVAVRQGRVHGLGSATSTVSALLDEPDPLSAIRAVDRPAPWSLDELMAASLGDDPDRPRLLAPCDLQVIKACGVTFASSMIERVIEEQATGDATRAAEIRVRIGATLAGSLRDVDPGSPAAEEVKRVLVAEGLWSPYLEVGIGPYPEVFSKAPVLSAVGFGAGVGVPSFSSWSNPEPELVLAVSSAGRIVGATLGNDVNLRDVEGRSALLLGMAKDNNASAALGPFIRLFDDGYTLDDARAAEISLRVEGTDGFVLDGRSSVAEISRDLTVLVDHTIGAHHQYPDGFVLYTGTLFAPTDDRDEPDQGFTHHLGDRVTIAEARLGALVNTVGRAEDLPPWEFGIGALLAHLRRHAPGA